MRDPARQAYDPAIYARLAAVKAAYDPDNRFRLNRNVAPSATVEARELVARA